MKDILDKIDYNKPENKEKMDNLFIELLDSTETCNEELYNRAKCEIYEMAYGYKISDEMADKWVMGLMPKYKWNKDQIYCVANKYGVDIPLNCAYILMNMLYSDSKNIYGEGDDEESIKKYIEGIKNWYYDEDSKYKQEEKVYMYGKVIVGVYSC